MMKFLAVMALAFTFSACGGGGGDDSAQQNMGSGVDNNTEQVSTDQIPQTIDAPEAPGRVKVLPSADDWETPYSLGLRGLVIAPDRCREDDELNPYSYRSDHFEVWSEGDRRDAEGNLVEAGVPEADVQVMVDQLEAAFSYLLPVFGVSEQQLLAARSVKKISARYVTTELAGGHEPDRVEQIYAVPLTVDFEQEGDQRVLGMPYDFFLEENYDGLDWLEPSDPIWSTDYRAYIRHVFTSLPIDTQIKLSKDVARLLMSRVYERTNNDSGLVNATVEGIELRPDWKALDAAESDDQYKLGVCITRSTSTNSVGSAGHVKIWAAFFVRPQYMSRLGLTRVVRHELAHVFQALLGGSGKHSRYSEEDRWFQEGFADYAAGRRVTEYNGSSNPARTAIASNSDGSYTSYTWVVGQLAEALENEGRQFGEMYLAWPDVAKAYDETYRTFCPDEDEYCQLSRNQDDGVSSGSFADVFEAAFSDAQGQPLTLEAFRGYIDAELEK